MSSEEKDKKVIALIKEINLTNDKIDKRRNKIAFLAYEIDKLEGELQVQEDCLVLLKEGNEEDNYYSGGTGGEERIGRSL